MAEKRTHRGQQLQLPQQERTFWQAHHKAVAELLVAKGADVNAKDNASWTPLHVAVSWARQDVPELLLAGGADVNAKDRDRRTPLSLAKTDEIRALLRKYGAK